MGQLPDQPRVQAVSTRAVRVIHISVQPKSCLGKLVAGIVAVAAMLVALFLSIVAFAILACSVIIIITYLLWATRRARRAMRDQIIDGEVKSRDVQ
jgi:ABC-type nickel/cobalt efflux system permease component RcnA